METATLEEKREGTGQPLEVGPRCYRIEFLPESGHLLGSVVIALTDADLPGTFNLALEQIEREPDSWAQTEAGLLPYLERLIVSWGTQGVPCTSETVHRYATRDVPWGLRILGVASLLANGREITSGWLCCYKMKSVTALQ